MYQWVSAEVFLLFFSSCLVLFCGSAAGLCRAAFPLKSSIYVTHQDSCCSSGSQVWCWWGAVLKCFCSSMPTLNTKQFSTVWAQRICNTGSVCAEAFSLSRWTTSSPPMKLLVYYWKTCPTMCSTLHCFRCQRIFLFSAAFLTFCCFWSGCKSANVLFIFSVRRHGGAAVRAVFTRLNETNCFLWGESKFKFSDVFTWL